MTAAQKRLRDLRARQSQERGRMAELGMVDALTDETRAELDTIESGTPDLERQIRGATVAVETEEAEQREAGAAAAAPGGDAEDRERLELRQDRAGPLPWRSARKAGRRRRRSRIHGGD